jgi:hypothetical protein
MSGTYQTGRLPDDGGYSRQIVCSSLGDQSLSRTDRSYTDSPRTVPWRVFARAARREPGGTSTRARGLCSRTAENSWCIIVPWNEPNIL